MTCLISHISSLEFWRFDANLVLSQSTVKNRVMPPATIASHLLIEASDAWVSGALVAPVHILVSKNVKQRSASYLLPHVWSASLPPRSLVRIAGKAEGSSSRCAEDEIFVCSPELCFLQMSSMVELVELIMIGFELCGAYSLSSTHEHGFVDRNPLTSVEKIQALLDEMARTHGIKQARRALSYVMPYAASPRETALAMLLCLPHALGGYGLGKPILNYKIGLGKRARGVSVNRFFVCDAYWPEAKLAVEYDSDLFHTGPERIARDAIRRNVLSFMDITVVTVTRKQINSLRELDKVAHILAKFLGMRIRPRCENFASNRLKLHSMVLRVANASYAKVR